MRLRRGKRATAITVAVLGGLLTASPSAVAAPDDDPPGAATADGTDVPRSTTPPAVWPRPQSTTTRTDAVTVTDRVTLIADPGADPHALRALREVLTEAGARTFTATEEPSALTVRLGAASAYDALRALRAPDEGALPNGGYRLAVGRAAGRDTIALAGTGEDGLFHGVQTLRQLVRRDAGGPATIPGVVVRDWPGTAVRGMTEGFYGTPWTREQRLDQIDFLGRTKQNRYLYASGDDPYRQARWRDPYPAERRAEFRALAERARENHVTLAWAVAPGQALCMSSDADLKALTRKLDAMWALGVRAFQLQFQDVSYSEWHCAADSEAFGSGPGAAAKAQARVADAVAAHLAERHPGAAALSLMPTEFFQDGATEYRTALSAALDDRVQVVWSGVGVVPKTITGAELAGVRDAFEGHPLVTMDNYPVNDWAADRLFLGPYTGRQPAVAAGSAELLTNAMEQPAASRIPLFTAADFAWNPRSYRPQESWKAAIDDLAGADPRTREAMGVLAGHEASSVLGATESAYLRPLIAEFWRARAEGDRRGLAEAGRELRAAFGVMRETPARLGALADEVGPWTAQLARHGEAGQTAVDLLLAQARGDGAASWRGTLDLRAMRAEIGEHPAKVGEGVLGPFLKRAARESDHWTGADRAEGAGGGPVALGSTRALDTVTVLTEPLGPSAPSYGSVEAHVPGEGWRRLGPLSADGWTQLDAGGLAVDELRLTGHAGRVHGITPWYADEESTRFELDRTEHDAVIGGAPTEIRASLTPRRPGDVRGRLTARAPAGIEVTAPADTVLPRGRTTSLPFRVTVPADTPAGTYSVPVTFGDQTRVVSLRAYPPTAGPDVLRGAVASSSGDETPDFPAAAALDDDPATRWSSPASDGAWWQAELPAPVRVGQVVLHWQDAYASAYRIQTSSDGRTWRTAATVRAGAGGREAIRMDARDTRYLRVQGDKRATEFGLSLFAVEAYAVAPPPKPKPDPKRG
ncbi:beta-N-acetylglucosaminidase domain-containing protein [Streptomyces sp. NPDC060194]|uniref:beta-N-acetylglucosaminidase domain-containing protein n=1 Tax=Streptomyces sp. NPDC060194 TaxID=3347069 RepID=UPI00366645A8